MLEAKKDLYERLVAEQAELDQENQARAHRMYCWEENKIVEEHLKRQEKMRQHERVRLEKELKHEKANKSFKSWLK